MARYRGRHRAPSTTGRTLARTAVAGAVLAAPAIVAPAAQADSGSAWDRLAQCESGGNWKINTGNGYYGGIQFNPTTWRAFGGSGMPHQASKAQQIAVAERVLAKQGWNAWPACSRKLGLHGTVPSKIKAAPDATPATAKKATAKKATAKKATGTPSGRTVTVASGDTLSRIASANDVDGGLKALIAANPGLGDPDRISVGDVVTLP